MKRVSYILILLIISVNAYSQSWIRVESLPFNTAEYSEISPFLYDGKLIFCKNPKVKVIFTDLTPHGQPLFDIYEVAKLNDGSWEETPKPFNEEITSRYNEGSVTISSDGKEIYFTKNISNSSREDNVFGIFRATLNRNGITNVREFKFNSEEYNVCFPNISKDGKQLFFCSDMPGGSGGLDIYVCTRTRSTWGDPQPLGDVINTRRNEVYPFFHDASGRLYFSTDGIDGGIGRKDIYYSENIDEEWQTPVNLGEPINSRRDDYSLIIDDELKTGYYTSDRNRSLDIFYFESTLPELDACKEVEENNYCFAFYDEMVGSIDTTTMSYEWDLGDGTKIYAIQAEHCFEGPGEYEIKLNIIDVLTGETYFNHATYHLPLEDIEQAVISCPDTVKVNSEISFSGSKSYIKQFEIKEYIWDFGDFYQMKGEQVNHAYKKPGQYTVKLGVTNGASDDSLLKTCSFKIITVLP